MMVNNNLLPDLPSEVSPSMLVANPKMLRGLRVVDAGWMEFDGARLVRDGNTWVAVFQVRLVRDPSND